jgi:hypothetical protein
MQWIVFIICLVLAALAGAVFWMRRPKTLNDGDDKEWSLLLFPGGADDPQGKSVAKTLHRMRFEARHLSETGLEVAAALTRLRPALIIAHQPSYGDVISRLEEEDSALASTPVLFLETRLVKGHSNLRVQLPPGAKPSQIGGAVLDLLGRRPTSRELSRRGNVQMEIEAGKVMEFLHFLHSMEKTGKIEIRTRQITGVLWMEKGGIVHAVVGRLEGLAALHSMLDFVQGTMVFTPGMMPTRRTILDGAMSVLAEYARRRDELAKASRD